jgi:hypothetical protein
LFGGLILKKLRCLKNLFEINTHGLALAFKIKYNAISYESLTHKMGKIFLQKLICTPPSYSPRADKSLKTATSLPERAVECE